MKIILILCDGMRPDALSNIPQVNAIKQKASYTMTATTVMPSVTLPCHMSLFHSVDPSRHGITQLPRPVLTIRSRDRHTLRQCLKLRTLKEPVFHDIFQSAHR